MQKILSRVIFIGFGIQIVLGILWMGNAFARFANPGEGVVCVVYMVLTGAVIGFVKRSIWGKWELWKESFVILSVLTFPFFCQTLMNPDYQLGIVVAVLFCTGVVLRLIKMLHGFRKIMAVLVYWTVIAGIIVGADAFVHGWTPLTVRFTERVVWTTLYKSYDKLSEDSWSAIDYSDVSNSSYETRGMRNILFPALMEDVGEEKTDSVLAELRNLSWEYEKDQIVKEVIWDITGYTVSPIVLQLQLGGRAYESCSGINYRELLLPNARVGKLYSDYSCWWFAVALILGLLICAEGILKKQIKICGCELWVVAVAMGGMVLWYTMDGAGNMDYKNTLFVLCIWLLVMSGSAMKAVSEEQAGGIQNEKE